MPKHRRTALLNSSQQQSGSVLLVSLVLLTALSILGLSAMRGSLTDERVAQQIQDAHLAKSAARSALRVGETYIRDGRVATELLNASYLTAGPVLAIAPNISSWTDTDSYQLSDTEFANDVTDDPNFDIRKAQPHPRIKVEEYYFEVEKSIGSSAAFSDEKKKSNSYSRVISRGVGLDGQNAVMYESTIIQGL